MQRAWLDVLRCPACGGAYELDATREAGDEIVEGFLVCHGCLEVRFVAGGSAILPRNLGEHLRAQGSVYRRTPLADPRLVRYVLAGLGSGVDVVPFEEVTLRYGDLAAEAEARRPRAPEDETLETLVTSAAARAPLRRALDLGTGVGRGAFLLAAHAPSVLGLDRSAARVRRARNLAVTEEGFRLPWPGEERREVELDLGLLTRRGVDFAVADPSHLPLAAGTFDLVVDRGGDGHGPWEDAPRARGEARRVLARGGLLVCLEGGPPEAAAPLTCHAGWSLVEVS